MTKTKTPLKMTTFEKFDGSVWRQYESPDALILLTEQGRKLAAAESISRLLRSYSYDYQADKEELDTRRFIAEGGNARVFSVKEARLAVKEKRPAGDDLFESLYRMDRLYHAVTHHCPDWIGIPKHYGIVALKEDTAKQFLLMEKIDEGVTVGDILHYRSVPREPHLKESTERLHGPITDEVIEEAAGRYEMILGHLRKALMAEYLKPETYIPDIDHNPYNIVVEPMANPDEDNSLKYWVIDQ